MTVNGTVPDLFTANFTGTIMKTLDIPRMRHVVSAAVEIKEVETMMTMTTMFGNKSVKIHLNPDQGISEALEIPFLIQDSAMVTGISAFVSTEDKKLCPRDL